MRLKTFLVIALILLANYAFPPLIDDFDLYVPPPDIVALSRNMMIYIVLLEAIMFMLFLLIGNSRVILYITLLIVFLAFISIKLVNWPYFVMSGTSSGIFYHSTYTKILMTPTYAELYHSNNPYGALYSYEYPGAYLVHVVTSLILGYKDLISSAYYLTLMLHMIIVLLIYIIAKRCYPSVDLAIICTIFFTLFNSRFWQYAHFSPQLYGLAIYTVILYMICKNNLGNKTFTILLIALLSLIISHVITSLMLIIFLTIYTLMKRKQKKYLLLLSLYTIGIVFYQVYHIDRPLFKEILLTFFSSSINIYKNIQYVVNLGVKGSGFAVYNPILKLYNWLVFIVYSFSSLAYLFKRTQDRFFKCLIVSSAIFGVFCLLISKYPESTFIDRSILMGYLNLSIVTPYVVRSFLRQIAKKNVYAKVFSKSFILAFIAVATLFPLSIFNSYGYVQLSLITKVDITVGYYLLKFYNSKYCIISDDISFGIYYFFNLNLTKGLLITRYKAAELLETMLNASTRSCLNIISWKLKIMLYYYHNKIMDLHLGKYDKVYDNGLIYITL